jgi:hypothetical protein
MLQLPIRWKTTGKAEPFLFSAHKKSSTMSNNTTYAARYASCDCVIERPTGSLTVYKVSKEGNESLLNIQQGNDQIVVTLRHAKLLLESLSRLIEDRTITGPQPVYNFRECVNAGRIVKRG